MFSFVFPAVFLAVADQIRDLRDVTSEHRLKLLMGNMALSIYNFSISDMFVKWMDDR